MSKPTIYQHFDYGSPVVSNNYGSLGAMLKKVLVTGYSEAENITIESYIADDTKVVISTALNLSINTHWFVKRGGISFDINHRFLIRSLLRSDNGVNYYLAEHDSNVNIGAIPRNENVVLWKKPLGWTIAFEDELQGKYVFVNQKGWHLRVHDEIPSGWNVSWSKSARVTLGREMWDIDTFKEYPTPYSEILPEIAFVPFVWNGTRPSMCVFNYAYVQAWGTQNGDAVPTNGTRQWSIIGDENTFYLFQSPFNDLARTYQPFGVTAIKSYYDDDETAFALWGCTVAISGARQWYNSSSLFNSTLDGLANDNNEPHYKNSFIYRTRGQTNFNYPSTCKTATLAGNSQVDHRSGRMGWGWDDNTLNTISLLPYNVVEKFFRLRGELVGAKFIPQTVTSIGDAGHSSNMVFDSLLGNVPRKIAMFNYRHRFDADHGSNYVAMELDTDWSEHLN